MIDIVKAQKHIDQCWGDEIVPTLAEYIKIPNKSPAFDPDWAAHGYMEEAVSMFERWARAKLPALPGASLETIRLAGRGRSCRRCPAPASRRSASLAARRSS